MAAERRTRERIVLAALLVVGALLRIGYLVERQAAPDFERPVVDAGFHDDWARCVAFGEERAAEWRPAHVPDPGLGTEQYLRPPGFPFLLAAVYRLTGGSPMAAVCVQMLLGLLSIALAWEIAKRFGPLAAAIGGGVMATHWALIFYEGELHAPPLVIALQLGMVVALLRAADRGSRVAAFGAGVLLGLGALTRPNVIAQLVVVVPWLVLAARRRGRPALAPVGALLLGAALAIAPVTIRNARVSGEPVLVTAGLGVNLWIGNHDGADGLISSDVAGMGTFRTCYDWSGVVENVEREVGRELTASEVSDWFRDRATDWITAHPGEFVALTLRKAALFWGPVEIAHNKDVAAEKRFSPTLRWLPFPFPLLAFAAFAGLALYVASRRGRGGDPDEHASRDEVVSLVAGLLLVTFLSLLPFFAAARYRVPVVPFLALLAALVPAYRRASILGRVIALTIAGGLVVLAWASAPEVEQSDERFHLDRGRALYNQVTEDTPVERRDALYAAAREELERALEIGLGSASAQFELGVLEQRIGDLVAARERYEACLIRDPRRTPAHFNLGFVHEGRGDKRAAIQSFRAAARFDPSSGVASFHQGRLLASVGRLGPAIEALRTSHARDPESSQTTQILARYLVGAPEANLRDLDEGLRLAEELPREGPGLASFEETRARAYAATGRTEDARRSIESAIALTRANGAPPRELERLGRVRDAIAAGQRPWEFR